MKFYTLKLKHWDDNIMDEESEGHKVYPRANGKYNKNADGYFWKNGVDGKINFGSYVDDAPLFDYYFLYNSTYQREHDWILLDAYSFIGPNSLSGRGFLVSERFKQLLEQFTIAKPYRFYESRLMYQGKKLVYHIFHLAQNEWNEFNQEQSSFFIEEEELDETVSSNRELKKLIKANPNLKMKIHLNEFSDIFYFSQFGYVVSEDLKIEIEQNELLDFKFIELQNVNFTFNKISV